MRDCGNVILLYSLILYGLWSNIYQLDVIGSLPLPPYMSEGCLKDTFFSYRYGKKKLTIQLKYNYFTFL